MNYKYIFYVPQYQSNSNGLTVLWEAALNFSQFRDITMCVFNNGGGPCALPDKFSKLKIITGDAIFHQFFDEEYIVVYPDVVPDNPLGHPNVARYLMCKPYILNGTGYTVSQNDYCFSYSKAVSEVLPQYTIIGDAVAGIKKIPHKVKTNKVVLYFGKTRIGLSFKGLNKFLENFDEIEIISRKYPTTKEEMYNMIAESRLLISFDPLTSVCHESTLLGTPVYIYDSVFKSLYDMFNFKLHGFYYNLKTNDLERVYEESQDLHIKAKKEVLKCNENTLEHTVDLISDMEDHFINKKSCYDLYSKNMENDLKFFKNVWQYAAIFNIISNNSLLRYLMVNRFQFLGILVFMANRVRIKLVNFMKNKINLLKSKINLLKSKINLLKSLLKSKINLLKSLLKSMFGLKELIISILTQEEKDTLKNILGRNKTLDIRLREKYNIVQNINDDNILVDDNIVDIHIDNNIAAEKIVLTKLIKRFWN